MHLLLTFSFTKMLFLDCVVKNTIVVLLFSYIYYLANKAIVFIFGYNFAQQSHIQGSS